MTEPTHTMPSIADRIPNRPHVGQLGVLLAVIVVLGLWLLNTPDGLLGKADAIGYAVCHRIDLRSFHLEGRALPLCARCTGLYLGVALTFTSFLVFGRGKAGGNPPPQIWIPLSLFGLAYVLDGANSYLHFFPNAPHTYPPSNTLRVITGTLAGVALVSLIFPTLNQIIWRDWQEGRVIASWRELAGLCAGAVVLILLVLTENPLILYPLSLVSAGGVILLLTYVHTSLVLMITRRESRATSWRDLLLPSLAGLTIAFLQIGSIDLVRFLLTGTWDGFAL
jgi:uncharacterized membrane protein